MKLWLTRGGYVAMRRSRHITGIHWLWSKDTKRWVHYTPIRPKDQLVFAAFHKLWYRGKIQRDDIEELTLTVDPRRSTLDRYVHISEVLVVSIGTIISFALLHSVYSLTIWATTLAR